MSADVARGGIRAEIVAHAALAGFEPQAGCALVAGERVLVADGGRGLAAVRLDDAVLLWSAPRRRPAPEHYRVPRRVWQHGRSVWASDRCVVQVFDVEDGVAVAAHALEDGRELWRRHVQTPPPLPWTEPAPVAEDLPTEELHAFLAEASSGVLALVLQRTTRTTMVWPTHPRPPFRAQLELTRLDPDTGATLWQTTLPEVHVPILEKARFAGWYACGRIIAGIDWHTGTSRTLAELPGTARWPRVRGGEVAMLWHGRGELGVELAGAATGERRAGSRWRRAGAKDPRLHASADALVLQLGEQLVSLLGEELEPRWEARVKPFTYGVVTRPGQPIVVGTSGAAGAFYVLDRAGGRVLAHLALPGGAWEPAPVDEAGVVVSPCATGLAILDVERCTVDVLPLPWARQIAGVSGRRVVVLTRDAGAGVAIVEVERI